MKFSYFLLTVLSILSLWAKPFKPGPELFNEIIAGPLDAEVGISPLTGAPSGWYTSDVTIHVLAPSNVLANGKSMPGGLLTISDEGQHQIELQPGPAGRDNMVTQFIDIDKTPPTVNWISPINTVVAATSSELSAEISDRGSGICLVELSIDHGRTWIEGWNAAGFALDETIKETTWTYHIGFPEFSEGAHIVILRAQDCAGLVSPGEILVVQVK